MRSWASPLNSYSFLYTASKSRSRSIFFRLIAPLSTLSSLILVTYYYSLSLLCKSSCIGFGSRLEDYTWLRFVTSLLYVSF